MQHPEFQTTGNLIARDGTKLFFRQFKAASRHRAGLVIAHGLCEHSGRYTALAEQLAQKEIYVTAHDHRGHGQSGGKPGCIRRFADYIDDLQAMIEKCRNEIGPQAPLLILGHSLGGLMVLNYAEQGPEMVSGVIASSPALAPAFSPPGAKAAAARIISGIWPSLTFDNELPPEYLSHDNDVVEAYIRDPLVHRRVSARLFTEMMDTMARTRQNAGTITMPILMQIAGADRLVDPQSASGFYEQTASADKTIHHYPDLFHEIYNETPEQREKVIGDLEEWIEAHIG